ncbi:MAG: hypothetical protein ACMUIA_06795 [bacterium]
MDPGEPAVDGLDHSPPWPLELPFILKIGFQLFRLHDISDQVKGLIGLESGNINQGFI